jgi:hypothetical protein
MYKSVTYIVKNNLRKRTLEELHNLYASPSVTRMIKSKRMGWVGRVARVIEMRNTTFCSGNRKGRDHSEDLGVDGRIILDGS